MLVRWIFLLSSVSLRHRCVKSIGCSHPEAAGDNNPARDFELTQHLHSYPICIMGGLPGFVHRHAEGLPLRFRKAFMERHWGAITMLHERESKQERHISSDPSSAFSQDKHLFHVSPSAMKLPCPHIGCLACPINCLHQTQKLLFLGVTYIWPPTLAKLSLIVLYHRINPSMGFRVALYVIAFVITTCAYKTHLEAKIM